MNCAVQISADCKEEIMFHTIDYEKWERKEIFERFAGYTYNLTAEVDVTQFLERIHGNGYKFYPSVCWCIADTVNSDRDFRYAKVDGAIGYYEKLNPCYTLMRKGEGNLFTHMVTDFDCFYKTFLEDKEKAENGSSLYYYGNPVPGCVDITILPNTAYQSICYVRPASFVNPESGSESYIPFITVGKYREIDGRMKMAVTGNFNHAANDGYHAEKFFRLLQEKLDAFSA